MFLRPNYKAPNAFLDRKGTQSLCNDIRYTPSPEETAALERQVAAKAARKAEQARRRKDAKAMRSAATHDNSRQSLDDGTSVFSVASTSTYSSFRKMLPHKTLEKTAR
ncbi:hypothetical protein SEPCBS57363_000246 [Sporothrix epigloea]|uniref:Uncharacterized protein n=1 Tax=Sporothrix epigloea TaxID=1892477 RepID=A0ABP0D3P1_9PEZI